jgi:RNA polymerase-binding transcription factor DksA
MATKKTAPAKAAKPAAKKTATKKTPAKKTAPAKTAAKKAASKKPGVQQPAKKTAQPKSAIKKGKREATSTKKAGATSMPAKQDTTGQPKAQAVQQKKTPAKQAVKEEKQIAATKAAKPENTPMPKKAAETSTKEVKAPKTSVKTSVPYQPEYKPLEQRQEGDNKRGNEPLVRYNDNDLNEFKELINKKLDAAKKELAYLQGLITRKDHLGGDETDNRYMTMEDGGMSMEREQLSQMASRQITYIDHLEKALIRIENKTYGICRVTGKLIDKARLRAVPHATLSLEAKLGLVKPGGGSNNE